MAFKQETTSLAVVEPKIGRFELQKPAKFHSQSDCYHPLLIHSLTDSVAVFHFTIHRPAAAHHLVDYLTVLMMRYLKSLIQMHRFAHFRPRQLTLHR